MCHGTSAARPINLWKTPPLPQCTSARARRAFRVWQARKYLYGRHATKLLMSTCTRTQLSNSVTHLSLPHQLARNVVPLYEQHCHKTSSADISPYAGRSITHLESCRRSCSICRSLLHCFSGPCCQPVEKACALASEHMLALLFHDGMSPQAESLGGMARLTAINLIEPHCMTSAMSPTRNFRWSSSAAACS